MLATASMTSESHKEASVMVGVLLGTADFEVGSWNFKKLCNQKIRSRWELCFCWLGIYSTNESNDDAQNRKADAMIDGPWSIIHAICRPGSRCQNLSTREFGWTWKSYYDVAYDTLSYSTVVERGGYK